MGKISTKELLDRFFESEEVVGTHVEKQKPNIDRIELYNYEEQINKELIDMDVDDLFGLINEFTNKKNGQEVPFMTSHYSYNQIATLLRAIFNFYIDNIEVIKNPLYDKRMRGREATKRLAQGKNAFNWGMVEDAINKLHEDIEKDRADYIELLLLLYYCGFERAEEIVTLKENMINHREQSVSLPGRTVYLSSRCYKMLVKFHNQDKILGWRDYILKEWKGGYFKFIIQAGKEFSLDNRPISEMCDILNRLISVNIAQRYGIKINYRMVYFLGFYDFLVKRFGESEVKKIVLSFRDSEEITKLTVAAKEYGVKYGSTTHLKRYLRPYIKE